ncbi:MAG: vitamin B12 dependent-methionine synthase activation domain-containing protein, partial [Calditrichota bacterium]
GAARATIDGVRALKESFPRCPTILGISNVSFGLPAAGREVINSVFLQLCVQAGLDIAIVNTERLRRYPSIPEEDILLTERLLFEGDLETILVFNTHFRRAAIKEQPNDRGEIPVDERLSQSVVEARRTGLESDLEEMLRTLSPLDILNGPLMRGMDEVGWLFRANRLTVAEVLDSAEIMKAAVDYLKPRFQPGESNVMKGRIILATVKGDVHDIGKNLVGMILSNNGFEVIDLGTKVEPTALIEAVRVFQPRMIGLSGLLVRSAHQMAATAADLAAANIDLPLLTGGAALTQNFVHERIAPNYKGNVFYASDAMAGLSLANRISDPTAFAVLIRERSDRAAPAKPPLVASLPAVDIAKLTSKPRWIETETPEPPDLDEHILTTIPLVEVMPLINPQMLFGKHLGMRGVHGLEGEGGNTKFNSLVSKVEEVIAEGSREGVLSPRAIYRWFPARAENSQVIVTEPNTGLEVWFYFPRPKGGERQSAVDWLRPPEQGGDAVALFVVTSGKDSSPLASEWREAGRLRDAHILQAAAIEIADATAEWLHRQLRASWGFADPPRVNREWLFKKKYRGERLSFGYSACPSLADQKALFRFLKPERIGVTLTEGLMMHPESSVSAVVFHHPGGRYYAV